MEASSSSPEGFNRHFHSDRSARGIDIAESREPALKITKLSGDFHSWLEIPNETLVLELKEELGRRLAMPISRLCLLCDDSLLQEAMPLAECGLASRLDAAKRGLGIPVHMSLVVCRGHVILVPDECGSIGDAVERLAATGGVVEVVGPPVVPHDVIELRDPRVNIIATHAEGVDVRGACLYIQLVPSSSTQNVCVQGLHNFRLVRILDCLHAGAIAFRNCDLFQFR